MTFLAIETGEHQTHAEQAPDEVTVDRLREAAEFKLKQLSFLSHDLNNNLSAVNLHLEFLKERLAKLPEFEADVSALRLAQQSIAQTTRGMRRLIAYERIRRQPAEPRILPVNLSDVIYNIAAQFRETAGGKGVGISVEAPHRAVVHSDGDLIALVVQNLVGNAVKYSGAGGVVRLRARHFRDGDHWVLSVSDQGPGIEAEHLEQIFAPFQRAVTQGGAEGVGLGLAIASEAAKHLGARLSVESQAGIGSTFQLALPVWPRAAMS